MKNDVQQLQQEIQKWDGNLSRLREALQVSQERVAKLEGERRPLAFAVRVDKDSAAADRLRKLDAEIATLRSDIRDDQDAISQAAEKLEQLRAALAVAEEEHLRDGAKRLITARVGLEKRVADLVLELKAEVEKLLASDREIVSALQSLHPPAAEPFARWRVRDLIWQHIGFTLRDPLLPTGIGYRSAYLADPREEAEQLLTVPPTFFDQLLEDIDALPAPAGEAEGAAAVGQLTTR